MKTSTLIVIIVSLIQLLVNQLIDLSIYQSLSLTWLIIIGISLLFMLDEKEKNDER